MSVHELLNPPEENVLAAEPTDEYFCRVCSCEQDDDEQRPDEEDLAVGAYPTPHTLSAQDYTELLRWMAQLFVSADAMEVPLKNIRGLRTLQRAFREALGRKQGRNKQSRCSTSCSERTFTIVKHL